MLQQNDTLTSILVEARKMIDERGEAGLRVAELAERCNVAVGLLYHYFKDRQALIAEVRAMQFIEIANEDLDRVAGKLGAQSTVEGLMSMGVSEFAISLHDAARRSNRWKRIEILAAAAHNERLRERVREEQSSATRKLIDLLAAAQKAGMLRDDIAPSAIALLIESVPLGTTIADISPATAPSTEEWTALLDVILRSLSPQE